MNRFRLGLAFALGISLFTGGGLTRAYAQDPQTPANQGTEVVGKWWTGSKPVVVTVADIMKRKLKMPNRLQSKENEEDRDFEENVSSNPNAPLSATWPVGASPSIPATADIKPKVSWTAMTNGNVVPPDVQGAVGPSQVLVASNAFIRVFNKAGTLGSLNTTLDTFFASVTSAGTTDPRVRFDRTTNRWIVIAIDLANSNNKVLVAISSGPTITNASSFAFYQFAQNAVGTVGDNGGFFDYPSLGVDANFLYIGGNIFNPSYTGSPVFIIRKSSITSGGPIVATAFRNIGIFTPMGVDNDDPAPTFGYFIGNSNSSGSTLVLRRVTNTGGVPSLSSNINVTVPAMFSPISIPALGSGTLDALGTRLFNAAIRTNRITGVQTLWTANNSRVNSSGVGSSTGDRTGSRYYQLGSLDTTPTLIQSGTLFSGTANDHRWMNSAIMTGQGHAILGCNAANSSRRPDIVGAFRLSSDPLGSLQPEFLVQASTQNYNPFDGSPHRWGDYTQMAVDPNDDMTMWGFHEFCEVSNQWSIRVFSVAAPPPATVNAVSPNILAPNNTYNLTVTGTSTAGSGWFEPGASFPNHLTASVSGSGVTVNSVTFNSPTQITLNVTVDPGATPGPRNLTITNPDGQSTTSNSAITVAGGETTVPPTSLSIFRGIQVSGGIPEVLLSDDSYLRFRPGVTATSSESPIDVTFTGTSAITAPSTLKIRLESRCSIGNIGQTVRMFNYQTNLFEIVDTRTLTTSDQSNDIVISSNASRFVRLSDGQIQCRVQYKAVGPISVFPYSVFMDQLVWLVTP